MSEVALISARKTRLSTDAKKGSNAASVALKLANDPDRFLSTVQIGITLIGILTGIYSGNKIASDFTGVLTLWGVPASYADTLAQGIIVVIVTYLTIIFGELVPKRIGLSIAEQAAKTVSRPMRFLSVLALPFVWLLSKSTEVIFNLLGIKESDNKVTEEEIKSIIQEGTEDGEVQPVEQDIMERVFLLGDLKVSSIMTHKNDIVWLDTDMTADDVKKVLSEKLYEFYPIAEGDLDHVKGIVNLKDLVLHLYEPDFKLSSLIHEAVFFHESMNVYKALEQMKARKISRALVCDEFGICMGVITLRDILEGLVGNMRRTRHYQADEQRRLVGRRPVLFIRFLVLFRPERPFRELRIPHAWRIDFAAIATHSRERRNVGMERFQLGNRRYGRCPHR